jgi:hypothetical protein
MSRKQKAEAAFAIDVYGEDLITDNAMERFGPRYGEQEDRDRAMKEEMVDAEGEITQKGWDQIADDIDRIERNAMAWMRKKFITARDEGHDKHDDLVGTFWFDPTDYEQARLVELASDGGRGERIDMIDVSYGDLGDTALTGVSGFGGSVLGGAIYFFDVKPEDMETLVATLDLGERKERGKRKNVREPRAIEIKIPTMGWEQIGGDVDPGAHGGTIAMGDGRTLELIKIQPVREHVGDKEAKDVGFPFWTRVASFDEADLDPNSRDVKSALDSIGMDLDTLEADFSPTQRAVVIAEALLDYGRADEGPAGWSGDIDIPDKVKWWGGTVAGHEYLVDEDEAFRDDVLGYGEIKKAIEEEVERLVDRDAADAWSYGGDQLEADLSNDGYDPRSITIEARFGDAIAVNGEPIVGPAWAKVLDHKANDLWSEVGTDELTKWLEKNGFDYLDKAGGKITSTEAHAGAETVIDAVAERLDVDRETVEKAAKTFGWWQEEIPGSSSGRTYVWAKKTAGVDEPRKRRAAISARSEHGRRLDPLGHRLGRRADPQAR